MAGNTVGGVDGLTTGNDRRIGSPDVDERLVVEAGERFLELGIFFLLDGSHFGNDSLTIRSHGWRLVVEEPVDDETDDGSVECEQPPVGQFLVVFLNAVVFVFAENDFTFMFGKLPAFWFG